MGLRPLALVLLLLLSPLYVGSTLVGARIDGEGEGASGLLRDPLGPANPLEPSVPSSCKGSSHRSSRSSASASPSAAGSRSLPRVAHRTIKILRTPLDTFSAALRPDQSSQLGSPPLPPLFPRVLRAVQLWLLLLPLNTRSQVLKPLDANNAPIAVQAAVRMDARGW